MNEDCAAVCSKCDKMIKGKVYDGYVCSNCYEVESLKKEIKSLKGQLEKVIKEKDTFYNMYNEYLLKSVKYENAFKALVEEITK